MKKNLPCIFLCLSLFFTISTYAQSSNATRGRTQEVIGPTNSLNTAPGGYFDVIFDRFGNQYSLSDLAVSDKIRLKNGGKSARTTSGSSSAPTVLYTGCTPGYFRIYLEANCGMDLYATDPIEAKNLSVLCQVLTDISNFIPSPCTGSGQTVNIWVRGGLTSGLGSATPFFNIPRSATKTGIADNTVWETLNSGVDAFKNISPPLETSGGGTAGSAGGGSIFFHASVAFNFGGSVAWHNDMLTPPAPGETDLYTVILHEMMHTMGFCTLIDYNGRSVFDVYNAPPAAATYQYYSRYDMQLQTISSIPLIVGSSPDCYLYQYSFNPAAAVVPNTILSPGGASAPGCAIGFYTFSGETDTTVCATAIRYLGGWGTPIPVYTPACFEKGGSLSHFDDQCYTPSGFCPLCATTNCEYFVMSNSSPNPALGGYSATTNPGVMKRYLTPEERQVLCDIGYPVLTTFGNAANLNNYSYGGSSCTSRQVVGFNDGITATATYAYSTTSGSSVVIPGNAILSNDMAAGVSMSTISGTYFKCLEVMTGTGTVSVDSGGVGTNVTYTSGATDFGVQLLRYIPVNASGVEGNISYIYIFVGNLNCLPTPCNLVTNGGFENLLTPGSYGQHIPGENCWSEVNGVPFLMATGISDDYYNIPNYALFVNGTPHPLSPSGNNHYVALWAEHNSSGWLSSSIQEELSTPLDSGQQYTITFWALLGGPSGVALTDPAYAFLLGTIAPYIGIDTLMNCCISNAASHLQFAVGSTYPLIGSTYITAGFMPAGFTSLAEVNVVSNNYLWQCYSLTATYNGPPNASTLFIQPAKWDDADTASPDSTKLIAIDDITIVPAANACPFSLTPAGTLYSTSTPFDLNAIASVCVPGGTFSWPTLPLITGGGTPTPTISTSSTFDPSGAYTASSATGGAGLITVGYTFTTATGCTQTVYTTIQVIDTTTVTLQVGRTTLQPPLIYPNPANNILHVDFQGGNYFNANCANYRLQSVVGQVVREGAFHSGHNVIPVSSMPTGIYLLEITDIYGQKTITKVVKQ